MQKTEKKVELYRELVPMAEATAVAYHIITARPAPLKDPHALAGMRGLVAIALSSVAPVLRRENGSTVPLSAAEVNERLFVRGTQPLLDDLFLRRVDLLHAIEVLKQAHVAFDREQDLESIRKLS